MSTYNITHRIHTLLHNAAGKDGKISEFTIQNITFTQEHFSKLRAWESDYWLAYGEIDAATGIDALNAFRIKLDKIVCALCLIGQAYTEYSTFSSLVTKAGREEALFFYYQEQDKGHNLMLLPEHVDAIEIILADVRDFSQFMKFWREITNTPDYIARLMLCCAAIDALTKRLSKNDWEKEKHSLRKRILGDTLKEKLYGNKAIFKDAQRHKLIHGEIQNDVDEVNTTNEIRMKIIHFFNKEVFKKEILNDRIVGPWRNPYKNFIGLGRAIRFKNGPVPLSILEEEFKNRDLTNRELKSFTYLSAAENNLLAAEF